MSQGRHGIKVLGLSLLAALGLMAFAASAQASGEWVIEENGVRKTFTEHGIASESVAGTLGEVSVLVPALSLTVKCASGTSSGTLLLGGIVHVSNLFSGCEAEGSGATCKPFETKAKMETNLAADKGFIAVSGLGELVLMGGKHYLLVESTEFTTVYWPKLCSLNLEGIVSGSVVFELPNALTFGLVNQAIKVIPQATLESLFPNDILSFGPQASWLDEIKGTALAHLSGILNGTAWGAQ